MTFAELTKYRQNLVRFTKEAGIVTTGLTKAVTAPARMAHGALWGVSKHVGGPLAPLVYGGAVLGTGAAAKSAIGKAENYSHGFNPQFQESVVRGG